MELYTCTLIACDKKDKTTGKSTVNHYKNESCIKNLLSYIFQADTGGAPYVGARNIKCGTIKQMAKNIKQIQKLFKKDNGRRMYHYVLSFQLAPTPENAKTLSHIAEDILDNYFHNDQIAYGIHTNTDNLHVHFVFSAVLVNGYKWNCRKNDFKILKKAIEMDACIAMNENNYEYRNGNWYIKADLEEMIS